MAGDATERVEAHRDDTVIVGGEVVYGAVTAIPLTELDGVPELDVAIRSCPFRVDSFGAVLVVSGTSPNRVREVVKRRDRVSRELSELGTVAVYFLSADELVPLIETRYVDGNKAKSSF